ncbi:MAG TPA: hypothetical protein VMT52_00185, partial [Planctomycetota bacterium]|nr:hypothetical protein [Planctomycetota bacterium]
AFRLTNERRKFVYLSDGGHFENLGLYEMLRRRCHYIVVGDAGCDPNCAFDDLGNAARKARIDMGIPIDFRNGVSIFSRTDRENPRGSCFAVADIDYKAVDGEQARNGVLLYIKPAFYGNTPMDVLNYARGSPAFPHEPTSDQFFSESQLESYRALGRHIVSEMTDGDEPVAGLEEFCEKARTYLKKLHDRECASEVSGSLAAPPSPGLR